MNLNKVKLVCVGGGSGLSHFVKGVKLLNNIDLTCVVTVADNGGSSGVLKSELNIPAVGDIRNVLSSLANAPDILEEMLNYRFDKGSLVGHSLGNLMLASLIDLTGSIGGAIEQLSQVFNVNAKVLASSYDVLDIKATCQDGSVIYGESQIGSSYKRIDYIEYINEEVIVNYSAVKAIREADIIVYSIGSLYTSIIPNLIIPGIKKALQETKALRVYFSNLMSQPGETDGFELSDYISAINKHLGFSGIDTVICHNQEYTNSIIESYAKEGALPVVYDFENLDKSIEVIKYDVVYEKKGHIRHCPKKIYKIMDEVILCRFPQR